MSGKVKHFTPRTPLEYIITNYRGLFSTIFLLPISVAYNVQFYIRNKFVFWMRSAPQKHDERVKKIQQQVIDWKKEGANEKLCTSRSGWLTMSELIPAYKSTRRNIEVNLRDILEIDETKQVVRVEPLVNMGQITAALLPEGWTLPVVPELDDLTVGGLIMGFGVESSSHKYGLFQYICESFEIVTAEGELLKCTKDQNQELFHLIPWSHGTLGILVAAELKIIPAKKYVRLKYEPVIGLNEIVEKFEKASRNTSENDFVECLQYSKDSAVLMTGNFADKIDSDGTYNPIGRWYKPWFYIQVESLLKKNICVVEYIPLRHYYHRHTRSLFWEMSNIISFGNHPVFRFLLGWALPPRIALMKYFQTETTKELRNKYHAVQDMLVPVKKLKLSLEYFDEKFKVYPLWLSPMAVYGDQEKIGFLQPYHENGKDDEMFVDIGAYGTAQVPGFDGDTELHNLEQFVIENNGYQALYAKTLLSRTDFRKMFHHTKYDEIREKMPDCKRAFGEVYDKVSERIAPVEHRKKNK
jgi:Delta24-sterol reductase